MLTTLSLSSTDNYAAATNVQKAKNVDLAKVGSCCFNHCCSYVPMDNEDHSMVISYIVVISYGMLLLLHLLLLLSLMISQLDDLQHPNDSKISKCLALCSRSNSVVKTP